MELEASAAQPWDGNGWAAGGQAWAAQPWREREHEQWREELEQEKREHDQWTAYNLHWQFPHGNGR